MPTREMPQILPMRQRAALSRQVLRHKLDSVLPQAMKSAGLDMWVVLCQEDDLDPVFQTMIPPDTWCPILQILVFHDTGDGVERINLSMTDLGDLFDKPWTGRDLTEQWEWLARLVRERGPERIGVNIGSVQWAAGGLTHNLYLQLVEAIGPEYAARLESAEEAATVWLATLTDPQIELFEHAVSLAHALLAECFSRHAATPGVTTIEDFEWTYWQRAVDLGIDVSFKPFFNIHRSPDEREKFGAGDHIIRPGDMIHSDVGIRYLGLCTDHQEVAYVLRPGETGAPEGLRDLMREANRLQDCYMAGFEHGKTGNELLGGILQRARDAGIPNPRVYSHSLGHMLHQPGPLIGLPWEQECCPGRGDVPLDYGYAFTMELSVSGPVPEWGEENVIMPLEQDVVFTRDGCRLVDGRQTEFHLI